MTVKLLLSPASPVGSAIIGVHGSLRMLDQPKRCTGYQFGCVCRECLERSRLVKEPPMTPAPQPWEAKAA
jgi:hypothetical protein